MNAGISLESSCIPPVNTVPHDGPIKCLWECSYGRWGLELCMEPSASRRTFCKVTRSGFATLPTLLPARDVTLQCPACASVSEHRESGSTTGQCLLQLPKGSLPAVWNYSHEPISATGPLFGAISLSNASESEESVVHCETTCSRELWLSIVECGHHMGGWLFCARLCVLTGGNFPRVKTVQTLYPTIVLRMRL